MNKFLIIILILIIPSLAYPHVGRLDSHGGHKNRQTGKYHCHKCPCGCREIPKSSKNRKQFYHYVKPVSAICTRAVDGDTIIVNIAGVKERVRLIGVDTPKTKHPRKPVQYFGKEASMFTQNMVEGKKVRLEFDQNQRDKYKRLLAYVYLEDGTFLNAEIVKQGYGHAYTKFPFKYINEFRIYEREARLKKRGLWK